MPGVQSWPSSVPGTLALEMGVERSLGGGITRRQVRHAAQQPACHRWRSGSSPPGSRGVFALDQRRRQLVWNRTGRRCQLNARLRCRYEHLCAFATNGTSTAFKCVKRRRARATLLRLQATRCCPLPLQGDRVYFSSGNAVYAVDRTACSRAGAGTRSCPSTAAYSATATSSSSRRPVCARDSRNSNGSRGSRTKTSVLTGGDH